MSWREKLKVSVSSAELKIFMELQRRRLTRNMTTQVGFKFDPEVDGVKGTFVDFYFAPYLYAVFLDGEQIHTKNRQQIKDELITKALERKGITVDRFMYKPPISDARLYAIADKIKTTLKTLKSKNNNTKHGTNVIVVDD